MPQRWRQKILWITTLPLLVNAFAPTARLSPPFSARRTFPSTSNLIVPTVAPQSSLPAVRSTHPALFSSSNPDQGGDSADAEVPLDNTKSEESTGPLQKLKKYFSPPDDGLTFRQRLAKMGLAAVLSYGWVSNMSYSVSVSLAWYVSSKRVRIEFLLMHSKAGCSH